MIRRNRSPMKERVLIVLSLGLTISTLYGVYSNWQLKEQLNEVPNCQEYGHKGYSMSSYNGKYELLIIQCSDNPEAGVKFKPIYPKPPLRRKENNRG